MALDLELNAHLRRAVQEKRANREGPPSRARFPKGVIEPDGQHQPGKQEDEQHQAGRDDVAHDRDEDRRAPDREERPQHDAGGSPHAPIHNPPPHPEDDRQRDQGNRKRQGMSGDIDQRSHR